MEKLITKRFIMFLLLVLGIGQAIAQGVTVSGTVTDASDGSPLVGVNIYIKGTDLGTVTDADGQFTVIADIGDVLTFSYIGFRTQEVEMDGRTEINISMTLDSETLGEVVVVGFGTQKKENVTREFLFAAAETE